MRELVEYSAICNGFPVVFSMAKGSKPQLEAMLNSLKAHAQAGEFQHLALSTREQSSQQNHVYFDLRYWNSNRMPESGWQENLKEEVQIRGKLCVLSQLILLESISAPENNPVWFYSVSGSELLGLTDDSAVKALKFIAQKVEEAKTQTQSTALSSGNSVDNSNNPNLSAARAVLMPAPRPNPVVNGEAEALNTIRTAIQDAGANPDAERALSLIEKRIEAEKALDLIRGRLQDVGSNPELENALNLLEKTIRDGSEPASASSSSCLIL